MKANKQQLFGVLTLSVCCAISQADTVRGPGPIFSVGPANDNNCQFHNITDALNAGASEVRLTLGTFNESLQINDRSIALVGGFANCQQANVNNGSSLLTTLSGDLLQPVVSVINDPATDFTVSLRNLIIRNGTDTVAQPGAGVYLQGDNTAVSLENVVIEDNAGTGLGINAVFHEPVFLKDVLIQDNVSHSGGGLHCRDATVLMHGGLSIRNNHANGDGLNTPGVGRGGGAYVGAACFLMLYSGGLNSASGTTGLVGNQANHQGGAVYVDDTGALLVRSYSEVLFGVTLGDDRKVVRFFNNRADVDLNDGGSGHGGAIAAAGPDAGVDLYGVDLEQNTAHGSGGAMALLNGADLRVKTPPTDRCWNRQRCNWIHNNSADTGGAAFVAGGSSAVIANAWIERNTANFGTALDFNDDNTAALVGSSVFYNNGPRDGFTGAAVIRVLLNADVSMSYNTLVDNNAAEATLAVIFAELEQYGNLIFQDTPTPLLFSSQAVLTNNCLYSHDVTGVSGNQIILSVVDPMIDRAKQNFHLKADSGAVDICDVNVLNFNRDIDGQFRGYDDPVPDVLGPYDIGADESYAADVIFAHSFE